MKKSALYTVFLVVLVDLIGFGIVLPLLPFFATHFSASPLMVGFLYSIYSLAQLVFSPIWGGLSDRIGRRPIMLLSTFGAVLAYLLFAFSHSLGVLFLSRLIAGVMGGNISTAQAYVADVTPPDERRARGMGLIGAAFGIGFVLGPAIATFLVHPAFFGLINRLGASSLAELMAQNKYALPGFFAALLSFCSFLLVMFKLPETVSRKGGQSPEEDSPPSKGVFTPRFWRSILEQTQNKNRSLLPILFACVLLLSFGQSSLYSSFPLFCKNVLDLTPEDVGMQYIYMGVVAVVIQGGMIRSLTKRHGETKLFLAGSVLFVLGLALIPLARNEVLLALFLCTMAVGGSLNGPTLNSLISKKGAASNVGALMGTAQGISGLGRVIGPAWGGFLCHVWFRLPFLLTAALVSFTIFAGFRLRRD